MASEDWAEKSLLITADSGFIAFVNAEKYHSFVGSNWCYEQLQQRFAEQVKEHNLLVWPIETEGYFKVSVQKQASRRASFREFTGVIRVTNESLYLTNYEDLTMAAQFQDEKIPANHNEDLTIPLPNGYYEVVVRQLFNPNAGNQVSEDNEYEVVFWPKSK